MMISRDFLTAGHAIFTVSNPTGEYYTYRVTSPDSQKDPANPIWFVSFLSGPNNTQDYTYLGLLNGKGNVWLTKASKVTEDAKVYRVAKWACGLVWEGKELPDGYSITHVGKCGRCGRPLTTPESLESGVGPVCAGKE